MKTLKDLKACFTIEDLQALGVGRLEYNISHRGGTLGFYGSDVAAHFEVSESDLPRKFGAYVNYLGGGLRGAICTSGFNKNLPKKKAALLSELEAACKRAYESAENEGGLNAEEDEDGETNWEAKGTAAARRAGIESAY